MRPDEVKKVNDLARSLKDNRLAANLEEAIAMAKRMLLTETLGEKRAQKQIEVEKKLTSLVDHHHDTEIEEEMDEIKKQVVQEEQKVDKETQELEDLKKEMDIETAELEQIKQDIEALREIVENAPAAAKELEREVKEQLRDKEES